MKPIRIYTAIAVGLLLSACASEAPFDGGKEKQQGSFAKSALNLQVHTDHIIKQTKAEEVNLDDVSVNFFTPDHQLVDHYIYGHMPSVVVLNEGDYVLRAVYSHFGEEKPFAAAFDAPFYQGDSKEFKIEPNHITSDLDVVRCELQNVMTSVVFDATLKQNMADDAYVELKINENSENPLNFTLEEEGEKHYGYFECNGEQTLVATFHGKINGAETSETKTVSNVSAGNHYRITFKLHDYQGENSGNHDTEVVLDASVTKTDVDGNISIEEVGLGDKKLDENERPGEDPVDPENPDDPTPAGGPQIQPDNEKNSELKINTSYTVTPDSQVELIITSETGITEFLVDIVSSTLTMEELKSAGMANHLDLVTAIGLSIDKNGNQVGDPMDLTVTLEGLKFPIKEQVIGAHEVRFAITEFLGMLSALGEGVHYFNLTVSDSTGTSKDSLILETK